MPIRFRCAYCNQLMGISRRKAGTVVRCPNCSGQVVVPAADEPEADPAPSPAPAPAPANVGKLFEQVDMEKQLKQVATSGGADVDADDDLGDVDAYLVPPPLPPPAPRGVVLSPSMVTLLSVAVVVVVALAFVAGLLIGRFALAR